MPDRMRSPFGSFLREERKSQGISQAELARRIQERFDLDPRVSELGVISDRAIANIEAAKSGPEEFVRPRPETVRVLMLGLGIEHDSDRGQQMLQAAAATQRRDAQRPGPHGSRYGSPFVSQGREAQLTELRRAWELAKSGHPQVVMIEGGAGVGKSRLVSGFSAQLIAEGADFTLALGESSLGIASSAPYLPWRRAMNRGLRQDSARRLAPQSVRAESIARVLIHYVTSLGGALINPADIEAWVEARVPELVPEIRRARNSWSTTDTASRHDEYADFLAVVSRARPMIIALEDLHWADESSCTLLLHVCQRLRHQEYVPLLIIGTYRLTDLLTTKGRHPLHRVLTELQQHDNARSISMEQSLEPAESMQFVAGLVASMQMSDDDRSELVQLLHSRTHGHPLFTTEVLERLIEIGALSEEQESTWVFQPNIAEVELPAKMRAIIEERIHRLSDHGRTILEAASVQGSPFDLDLLPYVTELPETEVAVIVSRELMAQHRLVQATAGAPERYLEFDHEVMLEMVYESLSPHLRRTLHRRTADALIVQNQSDLIRIAPQAAHHYEQAGLFSEAAEQALSAGFASLARLDHDLTAIWIERAEGLAVLAGSTTMLWQARLCRAYLLRNKGSLQEATTLAFQALAEAVNMQDLFLEARAHEILANIDYDQSHLDRSLEGWTRASEIFEHLGHMDRVSVDRAMLSHIALRMGRIDLSIRYARSAMAAAAGSSEPGLRAESLLAEGNALLELGRYDDAIDAFQRGIEEYILAGDMRGIMLCRMDIAFAMALSGRAEESLAPFDALQAELDKLQTPRLRAFAWLYHGYAHEQLGAYREAFVHYRRGLDARISSGLGAMVGDDLAGILRAVQGLNQNVEERLDILENWWSENDHGVLEDPLAVILTMSDAHAYLGNHQQALQRLQEAMNLQAERAALIEHPAMRESYLRHHRSGKRILARARDAGLVEK